MRMLAARVHLALHRIPLVASIFMAVHFWRVRKDGGISGPAPVMLESEMKVQRRNERNRRATTTEHSRRNKIIGWAVVLILLGCLRTQFRIGINCGIASAPDNIPIVAMLFLVPFYYLVWESPGESE